MNVFERVESNVRSYCRSWPTVFTTANGATIRDRAGREYVDFFAGAGALNYGHNHPVLKAALLDHIETDGVVHSLDMHTEAKEALLESLQSVVLEPRGLDHKVMFPGPTGTNAVEAALKLARKVTGREHVISFTNAFHGMTLGSLSVTGNSMKRNGAGVPLPFGTSMPYCNYLDEGSSLHVLESLLANSGSGLDHPAAVIVETVQGEGGINMATPAWLRRLADLCRRYDMLLIIDDIQMGVGRTGPFFSFEAAGIVPDIVTLSKSLSGYGLPLAVTLMRPELDVWDPGEHNGTFRGNNTAFVTATAALETFWRDDGLIDETRRKGEVIETHLASIAGTSADDHADERGVGLVWGLTFGDPEAAAAICAEAFARGLLVETSGPKDEVVKVMPPLTIDDDLLKHGLTILSEAVDSVERRLPATRRLAATEVRR
jgi:diaminobutyrate-2-oxoglutarate transaminase